MNQIKTLGIKVNDQSKFELVIGSFHVSPLMWRHELAVFVRQVLDAIMMSSYVF